MFSPTCSIRLKNHSSRRKGWINKRTKGFPWTCLVMIRSLTVIWTYYRPLVQYKALRTKKKRKSTVCFKRFISDALLHEWYQASTIVFMRANQTLVDKGSLLLFEYTCKCIRIRSIRICTQLPGKHSETRGPGATSLTWEKQFISINTYNHHS